MATADMFSFSISRYQEYYTNADSNPFVRIYNDALISFVLDKSNVVLFLITYAILQFVVSAKH